MNDQRREDGLIPGAIVLHRNSLEWRCNPSSQWRHPAITRRDLRIILICDQGYQSSLAAANLQQLGLRYATDLDGGFTAWAAAGLPLITPGESQRQPAGDHYREGRNVMARVIMCSPAGAVRRQITAPGTAHIPTEEA